MIQLGDGLSDRGVIITGAASGIGRETCMLFADAGARVCAIDRDRAGLDSLARKLDTPSNRHVFRVADLAHTEELEHLVRDAAVALGGLRALVHIAALLIREPLAAVSVETFDRQVDVNMKATFFLNRAAAAVMRDMGYGGRIINFTSAAWVSGPIFGSDAYVATKAGIVALTRGFARQFGPDGITVNVISPGQIDTPMQHNDNDPNVVEAAIAACPLGRMGRPDEVARVALFLASDSASFVSGATITVSGAGIVY